MGSRDAKLVVIAYSDVQCPFCGDFARDTLPAFEREFVKTGKVLFAFRHFPLDQLHPAARQAAQAIECADKQGQAWRMHDRLFANLKGIDGPYISETARSLGLNVPSFGACLAGPGAAQVAADIETGKRLAVTGTPTFFIGKQQPDHTVKLVERVPGAVPIAQWERSMSDWFKEMGSK